LSIPFKVLTASAPPPNASKYTGRKRSAIFSPMPTRIAMVSMAAMLRCSPRKFKRRRVQDRVSGVAAGWVNWTRLEAD